MAPSQADIWLVARNVRFTPKSGHWWRLVELKKMGPTLQACIKPKRVHAAPSNRKFDAIVARTGELFDMSGGIGSGANLVGLIPGLEPIGEIQGPQVTVLHSTSWSVLHRICRPYKRLHRDQDHPPPNAYVGILPQIRRKNKWALSEMPGPRLEVGPYARR